MENTETPQKGGGYGSKGGWKKWLLIYLVVGAIVYFLIWYFWLKDSGSVGGSLYSY